MVDVTEEKRLEQERDELLLREQVARAEVEAAVHMVQRLESITEAALAHAVGLAAGAGAGVRVPIGEGLTGRIAATGQPLIVDDAPGEVDLGPLRDAHVRSLVGVPLSADGALVGVVHAARRHRPAFSAEQARLLQLVGDRVSTAIRNARLFEDAQRATEGGRERSVFLADATTALFTARDPAPALATVASLAVPAVADWCAVDLRGRDGGYRRVALAHRDSLAERAATALLGTLAAAPPADGALGRALHTRAVQWRGAGATPEDLEARGGAEERDILERLGVAGDVCAPLVARCRTLGAVTFVYADAKRVLVEEDVALACELARRAAVAVDDRRRRRETRELLRLFTRLVSGAVELQRVPLELGDVVEAAARTVSEEAHAKNVAIDVTVDVADVRVCGDRRRLRQVAQRVLEGALRVTPTGGRVGVHLTHDAASAVLTVSAGGAAAAPVTGLRLAIVRRLLELHGGRVTTLRADGRGPTLTVRMPRLA